MTDHIHEFKKSNNVSNYFTIYDVNSYYCIRCFRLYHTIQNNINYKIKNNHEFILPYEYHKDIDLFKIVKLLPCITDKVYLKKKIKLRNLPIKFFKRKDLIRKMSSHVWSEPDPIFAFGDYERTLFEYTCQKCKYKIKLNPLITLKQSAEENTEILSCTEMTIKDIIS